MAMPERIWADIGGTNPIAGGWNLNASRGTEYVLATTHARTVGALREAEAIARKKAAEYSNHAENLRRMPVTRDRADLQARREIAGEALAVARAADEIADGIAALAKIKEADR